MCQTALEGANTLIRAQGLEIAMLKATAQVPGSTTPSNSVAQGSEDEPENKELIKAAKEYTATRGLWLQPHIFLHPCPLPIPIEERYLTEDATARYLRYELYSVVPIEFYGDIQNSPAFREDVSCIRLFCGVF